MTFPVEYRFDAKEEILVRDVDARVLRIDGVTLSAPDTFRPQVGDRIYADYAKRGDTGDLELGTMDLYVTGVEWRLRAPGELTTLPQYEMVMRVTLSSEAPSGRVSRRRAVTKKK